MKKTLSILLALIITILLFSSTLSVSAAGTSVKVTASNTAPSVGSEVKITVTYTADKAIGCMRGFIKYDASVLEIDLANSKSVETVNDKDISATGGAGVLKLVWYHSQSKDKTLSFTLVFKAKKAGSSNITLTTEELSDTNEDLFNSPSGSVTVNVQNPQKSGNANLSELYISSGSLSPAFSPSVTSYNIVIPYSVTVLKVSAETEDKDAKVTVEGSKNMKVGKNTRVIKVTAPNGTVKSYTLNITRQEGTGSTTPTGTEEPTQNNEAAKVTVGDQVLYISKDLKDVTLPVGYEQVNVTVNDAAFPSVQDKSRSIVLLYLTDENGGNGAFYVYNTATMTFSEFCSVNITAGVYAFLTPDGSVIIPEGFTQTFVTVNEKTIAAWNFPDEAMKDYYLVYALSPAGTKGLYQYDTVEGTLQRYTPHTVETTPVVEQDPNEVTEQDEGFFAKIKAFFGTFVARFGMTRLILMAAGVVILIAAIVVLIVLLAKRPKDYRH